ncbi:hypothetical protein ElyMa_000942500 [Elysia marginata]|uniref:Galectin n=1 Tax=Elysia marginata TaxID=1093978 RepID=A0AAV4HE95_9GAST|nr:hypothetical protein ElyMa_000942500 [Elysia marginata]
MPTARNKLLKAQPGLRLLDCFLVICSISLLAPSSVSASCPSTLSFSSIVGYPTGQFCTFQAAPLVSCGIACVARRQCKAVYLSNCTEDGNCSCAFCDQLTDVNFTDTTSFVFFLKLHLIGENTTVVQLTGGLTIGHPLLITIDPLDPYLALYFHTGNSHTIALQLLINFWTQRVETSAKISSQWTAAYSRSFTPEFSFKMGQEIAVMCLITCAEKFDIFLDKVYFQSFYHQVPMDKITFLSMGSRFGLSKIVSVYR